MNRITEKFKLKDIDPQKASQMSKDLDIGLEDIEFVRKGLTPSEIKIDDKDERSIISYITTAGKDRDNEIVVPKGADLEHYRKNPVVMFGHDYRDLPIGKNIWIKPDEKGLIAKTVYAKHEAADKVYQYRKDGFPLAESIGFVPIDRVGKDKFGERMKDIEKAGLTEEDLKDTEAVYLKWSLLEYSDVPVPSNPEALQLAISKGLVAGEEVHKPEETEDYIRIPVKDCKITATITVSEKEGIKALYCGKEKEIATYLFEKKKGWTMEKAKKWVADHAGKSIEELEEKAYECECIKCGYKMTSEKHCKDVACPECGGTMRRVERPGAGEERQMQRGTLTMEERVDILEKAVYDLMEKMEKLVKAPEDILGDIESEEAKDLGIENIQYEKKEEDKSGITDKDIMDSINKAFDETKEEIKFNSPSGKDIVKGEYNRITGYV